MLRQMSIFQLAIKCLYIISNEAKKEQGPIPVWICTALLKSLIGKSNGRFRIL